MMHVFSRTLLLPFLFAMAGFVRAEEAPPAIAEKPIEKERFAFVGFIDFDDDGQSDRKLLHENTTQAGALIDHEVDDLGVRRPAESKIDSTIKFLVVGKLTDPATLKDPKERKVAEQVFSHFKAMRNEAQNAGVRVVLLSDFFTFGSRFGRGGIRRVNDEDWFSNWEEKTMRLPTTGSLRSSGQTSGAYSKNKRFGQPASKPKSINAPRK